MLLAIDIGNTNTVFAVFDGGDLKNIWRYQTNAKRAADEYAGFLYPLLQNAGLGFTDISDIIIASVVPAAERHIQRFCEQYCGFAGLIITNAEAGIAFDMDHPEEAGADRVVNAVAVLSFYSAPSVVIDFGTATTFDVVDARSRYAGGVIAPGINLSVSALQSAAAKLPGVSIKKPRSVIGKNTEDAMQSGIYWGYLGLIETIMKGISDELGQAPQVILTGGLASLFSPGLSFSHVVDDTLTLKGLQIIHQNRKTNAAQRQDGHA